MVINHNIISPAEINEYKMLKQLPYSQSCTWFPNPPPFSDEQLLAKFSAGVANIAAVSLGMGYCTQASVPHSIINGFKNVLAIAIEANIDFPQADAVSLLERAVAPMVAIYYSQCRLASARGELISKQHTTFHQNLQYFAARALEVYRYDTSCVTLT